MARLQLVAAAAIVLLFACGDAAVPLSNTTEPVMTSIVRKTFFDTVQSFVDQFNYELNLNFIKNLPQLVREPINALTTKSLISFNLVSLAILVVSVFLTYFIYPFVSGGWIQRVTGLDFNFLNNKVDEINKRVSWLLEMRSVYSRIRI